MAQRTSPEAMPESTEELVEVLEVRRFANRAKGMYRFNGELGSSYNYHVGHRYPASKGGMLVAENLVVMPAWINWKLGDEHGLGLEEYKLVSANNFNSLRGFKEFCSRYDMSQLKSYVNGSTINDFERDGLDADSVLEREVERLGECPEGTLLNVKDYLVTASKFAELCGGLTQFEDKAELEDMNCMYLKYMEDLEVEMFSKENASSTESLSLSVDQVIEIYERRDVIERLMELEAQEQLGTPEALQLADELCPFELKENEMFFRVIEACR
ncbi:hypothetical protein VIN01S_08510 [Vibrio inusitatus NBRC 102082]|uniref:Uncharacterized protein n=1 Tax=Vibrio inusitatus NBRC 102082 TaxID=1219070 RepID=A0A4Y3HSN6_9VIBR|nr:hypothetical protein [Vibrio inusitatus]GEA50047.1 hypothetical protein VIN01S_08510 [Vibrio inusitatus NBRC 102082]